MAARTWASLETHVVRGDEHASAELAASSTVPSSGSTHAERPFLAHQVGLTVHFAPRVALGLFVLQGRYWQALQSEEAKLLFDGCVATSGSGVEVGPVARYHGRFRNPHLLIH